MNFLIFRGMIKFHILKIRIRFLKISLKNIFPTTFMNNLRNIYSVDDLTIRSIRGKKGLAQIWGFALISHARAQMEEA